MKDTPKKLGAVALAGVMVAGGTLQSGTIVSNAEGVSDRASTTASTMSDSKIEVYSKDSLLKRIKQEWSEVWRSELINNGKYPHFRTINAELRKYNSYLGDKFEILGVGRKEVIDSIAGTTKYLLGEMDDNFFGFEQIDYCYKTLDELKTGMPVNEDRVVNLKGRGKDYGGVPLRNFQKDKFYRVRIGDYMSGKPICHVFLYVKK